MPAGGRAIIRGPGLDLINGSQRQTVATRRGTESCENVHRSNRWNFHRPLVGSCGTAAFRAEQVIVSDIAADPLWTDFREVALAHSLRACWSTPIFSSEGKVIGTFAMYYREPRSPSAHEQGTIKHITHLAGIAIQRKRSEAALRASEQVARGQAETLAQSL